MKQNARAIAAIILTETIKNKQPLNQTLLKYKDESVKENSFIQALCYGVMRYYLQLEFIAKFLLKKPLPPKHLLVQNLILVGLFQLIHMRVPDHAAIFETVTAAKQLKHLWATKLINGLLRNFQREQATIMEKAAADLIASTSHPLWLLQILKTAWPEYYPQIIATNNSHPPIAIRVNTKCCDTTTTMEILGKYNITAAPIPDTTTGLLVTADTKEDLTKLTEFDCGKFSIQDGAAQLATVLLELQPGQTVLDACSAPGGKTCHMLEQEPKIKLTALDISASRVNLIMQNIARLKLTPPTIKVADAALPETWWGNVLFDRILLDAPCSATGIIRRQPDVKLFRTASDIEALTKQQQKLLTALWPLLKPGGILLYATCSVLPQENEQLLEQFIKSHNDAEPIKITLSTGYKLAIGQQILPGQNNMDGFYYAKLKKRSI